MTGKTFMMLQNAVLLNVPFKECLGKKCFHKILSSTIVFNIDKHQYITGKKKNTFLKNIQIDVWKYKKIYIKYIKTVIFDDHISQ